MRDELIKRNIIITISSLLIFFVLSFFISSYTNRQSLETELINISDVINTQIMGTNTEEEIYEVVDAFTNNQKWLRISLATSNGYVVKDSSNDAIGESVEMYLTEAEMSLTAEAELDYKRVYVEDNRMYYITKLTDDLIVRTGMEIQTSTSYVLNSLFYMLILVLATLLISIYYTKRTSKQITDAFDNISSHLKSVNESGEYQQIETKHRFKEVEESLKEINEIYKSIYQYIANIRNERNKINFIINNMQQGIIIVDEFFKIQLINGFAINVLRPDSEVRDEIDAREVIKDEMLFSKISNSLTKKQDYYFDYNDSDNEKIFSFSLTYISKKLYSIESPIDLLIILISDVTEDRTKDQVKAEFIANASHELKTPITSISGFAELLVEKDNDEKTQRYLQIIYEESIKMKATIDDLLYLSNLDYVQPDFELKEKVEFFPIIEEVINDYSKLAKADNISITSEIDDLYIYDNSQLVKHLISNLVENAIKYNKHDGSVKIVVTRVMRKIVLSVEDTGIGMEERHLSRVFDRFYRVDKSHKRGAKGGTGLGLNIVKQICAILNAKIEVQSTPGVGTKFTVTFNMGE